MRRCARSIVTALTLAACLAGSPAIAEGPTPDQAVEPLGSVSKRESFVFASTPSGLFRASLATKRWERLTPPAETPLGGVFAWAPGKSPLVVYVASRFGGARRDGARYGMYVSSDDGATWKLASEREDFGFVLLHPSGDLFAVTGGDLSNPGCRVGRSTDQGKTWRDITGTVKPPISRLDPDPDHPGLVRLHCSAGRYFIYAADDDRYKWTSNVFNSPFLHGRRPGDEFFRRDTSGARLRILPATLENYFRHDFGDQTGVGAMEVVPEKTRFEFALGAPVVAPIRVVLDYDADAMLSLWKKDEAEGRKSPKPTPPVEKFADQPDGLDFWGLRVETAGGRVERLPASVGPGRPKSLAFQLVDLSPSSPYAREIDLGRLADFSRPGEYRVQLIYNSGDFPDWKKGEWNGSFTSPVFTVVVRE